MCVVGNSRIQVSKRRISRWRSSAGGGVAGAILQSMGGVDTHGTRIVEDALKSSGAKMLRKSGAIAKGQGEARVQCQYVSST